MESNQAREAIRVSVGSIIINLLLTAFKLAAGIIGGSGAMVSDAVHSASDVGSTFVVIAGVRMSYKKADKEHPYGHERMECVAAVIMSALLFAVGLGIGWSGLSQIFTGEYSSEPPGLLALAAAVVSIVVKEIMFHWTRRAARRINSGALMADAWHHRSDAMSSVGSFLGILGARMGFPILDPLAAIIICLLVIKAAWDVFRDAVNKMTDRACDDVVVEGLRELVQAQEDVAGVDMIRTRLFGNRFYVDVEITVDGDETLEKAHAIAERVHDAIENGFPDVKHCMVHVNPAGKGWEQDKDKDMEQDKEQDEV